MRLLPDIGFGTRRYPEKIARRLRAVNVAVWSVAALVAGFGLLRLLQAEHPLVAVLNLAVAATFAAIPLLHRFGPVTAALAFIVLSCAFIFWVSALVGTGGGVYLFYLTVAALGVLFVGTERIAIAALLAVAAALLMAAAHLFLPHSTGFLDAVGLRTSFAVNAIASAAMVFAVVHYAVREIARAEAQADALLANILPPAVAQRLKRDASAPIADAYDEASILFADMAGFTARAADTEPAELVRFLNAVFSRLDAMVERHGLEKIKTSGDAYMVVSGVPEPRPDHAGAIAALALEMRDDLAGLTDARGRAVPLRLGIASGPVVAGVVGTRKFFYDVWGDAVNLAARMEQTGAPGRIHLAPQTAALLPPGFILEERGEIEVRGKGTMRTWFLHGRR